MTLIMLELSAALGMILIVAGYADIIIGLSIALTGIGVLFSPSMPWLTTVLVLAGGLFLVWLGTQIRRESAYRTLRRR
jgi:threonine/homoserine/homoserine lactone efflux protein